MFVTTEGIVLRTHPFKDNRVISKIYTKTHGLISFIIKKNKNQIILSQPLNIVEITYRQSNTHSLYYVNDCNVQYVYRGLVANGGKLSFAMLICEILNKSLNEANAELFQFIINSFKWLDTSSGSIISFDVLFLMKFCALNGIKPSSIHVNFKKPYFLDLNEGKYTNLNHHNKYNIIDWEISADMYELGQLEYDDLPAWNRSIERSNIILDCLIKYISIHLVDLSQLKSIKILKELI